MAIIKPIEIKTVPVAELKPHPRNAKLHPKKQVAKIAESIKAYGFNNPILIDSDSTILAGHGRYQAAKSLGLEEVPTICLGHLSAMQARAYIIADNKLAESGFDTEMLCEELFELAQTDDFDPSLIGFEDSEFDRLIAKSNEDDDELLELDKIKGDLKASTGQHWLIGNHRVIVGGRRLSPKRLLAMLNETNEPQCFYLQDRVAQGLLSLAEKSGLEIKSDVGF